MTLIFVITCIVGYVGVAIPTSIYARSRSVNKAFNSWYSRNKETNKNLVYTKQSDEDLMIDAMNTAKRYNSADWATVAFLSAFFWPVFIVGFLWHALYKKLESLAQPVMPRADIEKQIEQIQARRKLTYERKELIYQARKLGLDTSGLEEVGE